LPRKIIDFCALAGNYQARTFHVAFLATPEEALNFLRYPRQELTKMGIEPPPDCRVETTIENHDWLSEHSKGFSA